MWCSVSVVRTGFGRGPSTQLPFAIAKLAFRAMQSAAPAWRLRAPATMIACAIVSLPPQGNGGRSFERLVGQSGDSVRTSTGEVQTSAPPVKLKAAPVRMPEGQRDVIVFRRVKNRMPSVP